MELDYEAFIEGRLQVDGRMQFNGRTRLTKLEDAKNIAKYSFHCHRSVTYLDLSLQEYSVYKKRFPNERKFYHKYVCTDQGLQKCLQPLREYEKTILLQNFHLDISKEREPASGNVEYSTVNQNRIYDCETVYEVIPEKYIYEYYLTRYIEKALEKNTEKLSIIKLCLKFLKNKDFQTFFIKPGNKRRFIPLIIKYCSDFELLVNVLKMISFDIWIIYDSEPDQLEFFLYRVHALKEGRKALEKDMIYMGYANSMKKSVEILLKYQNCPKFSRRSYQYALRNLISKRRRFDSAELMHLVKPTENKFQGILTFLAFKEKSDAAFQHLRLLWRSLPMCFITLNEFKYMFGPMLDPEEIIEIYNFYTDIIEQHAPSCQPRMLKHYCRLKIRNLLYEQERLHDGIDELGLPLDLQLYLKLKK
ncbi:uncharacterized protein LOC129988497 [Argiope bruennichi]|uniref:SOCS box domain-containing protein n=1 Tax=Argiope bruennichi TaxID=94029 RepID=A0A8T0EFC6_ARGBR|nr:uncharacterized protein LOC129988497 [Argiope bruennichi]KAF8771323.1 hypothetical protein HNY73_018760 [Argiope bruennichi]